MSDFSKLIPGAVDGRFDGIERNYTADEVTRLRGSVHRFEQRIPLIVTYHPAYLLRSPLQKRKSWEDLKLAQRLLRGT